MKYIVIIGILNCTLYSHRHVHVHVFFERKILLKNQQTVLKGNNYIQSVGEKDKRLWPSKRREKKYR